MLKWIVAIAATLLACTAATPGSPAPSGTSPAVMTSPTVPAAAASTPAPSASATARVAAPLPTLDPRASGPTASTVQFADTTHGWLGVEDGILGTADGGGTWQRQLTGGRVTRIWSFDGAHAWALAADGTIYHTEDGTRWGAQPATTPPIADMTFVSALHGWAIAVQPQTSVAGQPAQRTGTLLVTTDGGAVWRPIGSQGLWSACFTRDTDGYGASGKRIYRTADGGRTWALAADLGIADQGPWYPTLFCADAQRVRVQITEPYAALSHVPYLVFATVDSAKTWKLEYAEGYTLGTVVGLPFPGLGSYPSIVGVLPDRTTWLVTCSPPADTQRFLVLTGDGQVRADESVPFVACARAATFVDARHGWAIATSYTMSGAVPSSTTILVRTTDGARSWTIIYPR